MNLSETAFEFVISCKFLVEVSHDFLNRFMWICRTLDIDLTEAACVFVRKKLCSSQKLDMGFSETAFGRFLGFMWICQMRHEKMCRFNRIGCQFLYTSFLWTCKFIKWSVQIWQKLNLCLSGAVFCCCCQKLSIDYSVTTCGFVQLSTLEELEVKVSMQKYSEQSS